MNSSSMCFPNSSNDMPQHYRDINALLQVFFDGYNPLHKYFSISLSIFGLIANSFNVIVLTRPDMRASVNWMLVAIAISDMCLMATNIIFSSYFVPWPTSCQVTKRLSHSWISYLVFHISFSIWTHSLSLWLTVWLALMRYCIVRLDTKWSGRMANRSISVVGAVLVTSLAIGLLCLPNFLCDKVVKLEITPLYVHCRGCPTNQINQTYFSLDQHQMCGPNSSLTKAKFWIQGIAFKIVPCLLLTLFIALLISVLCAAATRRRRLMRNANGSNLSNAAGERTTLLLICIVLVTLITEVPQGALTILCDEILLGKHFYNTVYSNLADFLDLLSLINCCSTYIIYSVMSKRFRDHFVQIFLPRARTIGDWRAKLAYTAQGTAQVGNDKTVIGEGVPLNCTNNHIDGDQIRSDFEKEDDALL